MKVLQVTVHYSPNIGGVETHLTDLVAGLQKLKDTVFVLTYRPLVAKSVWKILEKSRGLTILRLPWLPGFFYKFNNKPIIEFIYLTPGLFLTVPFVIIYFRPQVIHAHGLVAGFISVWWGKIFRKKVIVSTHSLYRFPRHGLYFMFAKWIFNNAAVVLCLSQQSVKEIETLGVPAKNIERFTYWIDTTVFRPIASNKNKVSLPDKFIVLFVGRLIPEKGIRELLQAARLVDNSFVFVLIGDGPLAEEISIEAQKRKDKILFIHKLQNTETVAYYSRADVVIAPSTHEEGFGRVLLESLACGTPVIAANRGAIPEAINSTVGELITITPKNIADTLISLKKNKQHLTNMRNKARSYALKYYSENNLANIIDVYKDVM